jgi:hypothetical protein
LTTGTELDLASEAAPDVTSAVVADFKRWIPAKGEDLRHEATLQRTNMVDDVVNEGFRNSGNLNRHVWKISAIRKRENEHIIGSKLLVMGQLHFKKFFEKTGVKMPRGSGWVLQVKCCTIKTR